MIIFKRRVWQTAKPGNFHEKNVVSLPLYFKRINYLAGLVMYQFIGWIESAKTLDEWRIAHYFMRPPVPIRALL